MARVGISRGSRSAGVVPLLAGIGSALALAGAAVYTVDLASCSDPGRYIRHDNHVELVGSCVDGSKLPARESGPDGTRDAGAVQHGNYQP
ncbi:hypothetical protein ABZ639_21885 [Saccharomonospora sp. NPDC006951]